VKESFEYTKEEVDIRNNNNNIDLATINVPENISVSIEYLESIGKIVKSDIVLYIDLSQEIGENGKYDIKYDTKHELKNIAINPNKTQ
ncbi:MAG: CdaR family protein, partial [Romboutsia sp.]